MHLSSDDMRSLSCSTEYFGYTAVGGHDKLITLYDLQQERILSFIPSKGVISKVQWSSIHPSILVWSNDESILEYADIRCTSRSSTFIQKIRSSALDSTNAASTMDNRHTNISYVAEHIPNPSSSYAYYTNNIGMFTFSTLDNKFSILGYGNGYLDIIEPLHKSFTKGNIVSSYQYPNTSYPKLSSAKVYQRIRDPYVAGIDDIHFCSNNNTIICSGINGFSLWKLRSTLADNTGIPDRSNGINESTSVIECIGFHTLKSSLLSDNSSDYVSLEIQNKPYYTYGSLFTIPSLDEINGQYDANVSYHENTQGYISIDSLGMLNIFYMR